MRLGSNSSRSSAYAQKDKKGGTSKTRIDFRSLQSTKDLVLQVSPKHFGLSK